MQIQRPQPTIRAPSIRPSRIMSRTTRSALTPVPQLCTAVMPQRRRSCTCAAISAPAAVWPLGSVGELMLREPRCTWPSIRPGVRVLPVPSTTASAAAGAAPASFTARMPLSSNSTSIGRGARAVPSNSFTFRISVFIGVFLSQYRKRGLSPHALRGVSGRQPPFGAIR